MKGIFFYTGRLLAGAALCAAAFQNISAETGGAILREADPQKLITSPKMRQESEIVGMCLERGHYLKMPFENLDSREIVREYMASLDVLKMFFLATDVQHYQDVYAPIITTLLRQGIMLPANKIYHETFVPRAEARLEWIKERMKKPFDFTGSGTFSPDRSKESWPLDMAAADDLWEKRISYDVLNQIIGYDHEENSVEKEIVEALDSDAPKARKETPSNADRPKTFEEKLEKAKSEILTRYESFISNITKDDAMEIQEIFLNSLASMYDPHSAFLSEYALEDFNISMINKLFGIGATLTEKDGYCEIVELVPGSPADKSKKLQNGDKIVAVAQGDGEFVDVIGRKLRNTVRLIRGKEGTVVRLQVEPKGSPGVRNVVTIVREEIQLTTKLAKARIYEVPEGKKTVLVGVIDLPAFYGENEFEGGAKGFSATKNVEELLEKLKARGVKGVILDFRKNGGGLLPEAINLAGLFIRTGPVLQVKDVRDVSAPLRDNDPKVVWDGPLMVLVSRLSASAAEIVAGALQNHGRAIILGDSYTYGKGTVQNVYNLSRFDPSQKSAAKVTVQKWYLPNGESIQVKGVKSDIRIPSVFEVMDLGEDKKERVLEWDFIDPIPVRSYGYGEGEKGAELLKKLKSLSQKRQDSLDEFKFLNDRVSWFEKRRQKKEWSLNYNTREELLKQDEAYIERMKKRQQEFEKQNYKSEEILLDSAIENKKKEELAKSENSEKSKSEGENPAGEISSGKKAGEKTSAAEPPAGKNPADKKSEAEIPAKGTSPEKDAPENSENDEDSEGFDIQLREALRIMADWISIKNSRQN